LNINNRIDTHDKATELNIKNRIDTYNKAMELLLIMLVIYLFNISTYPLCSPKFISYNTEVYDKLSTNRCDIASFCVVGRVNITLCKVMSFAIYLLFLISVYYWLYISFLDHIYITVTVTFTDKRLHFVATISFIWTWKIYRRSSKPFFFSCKR
jgi:hypothetical protein